MSVVRRLRASAARSLPHGSLRARVARGSAWSLVAAATGQGASLLAGVLTARILGASAYGQVAIVIATTGMLGVFAGLGLGMTATRSVAESRGRDDRRAARRLALLDRVVVVSGVVATVILVVSADALATIVLGDPAIARALRLGAPLLVLGEIAGVQTGALAGFEAFREVATIAVGRGVATVGLATAGALVAGVDGAILGMVAAALVAVILGRIRLRHVRAREGLAAAEGGLTEELPVLWQFALPAFIAGALVGPVSWIGSAMLVNQPDGFAELGVFNAANQWRNAALFLPLVVGQAVLPVMTSLFAAGRGGQLRRVVVGAIGASLAVAAPIGVVLVLARDLIMSLYGPEFAAGGSVLAVVGLTVVVMAGQAPVGQLLAATGKMWLGAGINLAWAVVFLAAAAVLVPAQGALGLALAYLVSYVAQGAWSVAAGWYVDRRVVPAAAAMAAPRIADEQARLALAGLAVDEGPFVAATVVSAAADGDPDGQGERPAR